MVTTTTSNLDTVLLIITSTGITVFFVLAAILTGMLISLVSKAKAVVAKAEGAIDSVEAAAAVLKNARGSAGAFNIIKNIMDLVNNRSQK